MEYSLTVTDTTTTLINELILTYSERPERFCAPILSTVNKLGTFYKKNRVFKKAAQVFENLYKLSKIYNENKAFISIVEAFYLYSKLNDHKKASDCYEKAKSVFPNYEYFDYYFKILSKTY